MKIKKMIKNDKYKTLIFMIANCLSFLFAFIINVLLTNISSNPDLYGQYKYSTNFILTLPSLFSMGITWSCASLLAKDDFESKNSMITASLVFTTIIGLIVSFGIILIYGISCFFGKSIFHNVLILVPFINVFFLQKLINQIYMGQGESFKLSLYSIFPNFIIFICFAICFILNLDVSLNFCILVYLFSFTLSIVPKLLSIKYNFQNFKSVSKLLLSDVKESGFKVHISTVFTTTASQVIALVCGNIYGFEEYGYYSLAVSLAVVFQIIGNSLSTVNFKKYANENRIRKMDFIFMVAMSGLAYLAMILLIDKVFFWFYPSAYAPAIKYLKISSLSYLIYGFAGIFNRFFIGKNLGKIVLYNSIFTAIASIIISIPLIWKFELTGLIWSSVIVSVLSLMAYIISYNIYLKRRAY